MKKNQNEWTDGVNAIDKRAKKTLEEIRKQEVERQERRDEYINWHIKKYGKPPNPNFFRGVDDSSSSRSGSRSNSRGGL